MSDTKPSLHRVDTHTSAERGLSRRSVLAACSCFAAMGAGFTALLAADRQDVRQSASLPRWRNPCAVPDVAGLPADVAALVASSFEGLKADQLWDTHAHLLGNGDAGSGCRVHPDLTQGFDLHERIRHPAILNAACVPAEMMMDRAMPINDGSHPTQSTSHSVDRAFVSRLRRWADAFPVGARWCLFAFEDVHDDQGRPTPERSTFYVPNAYAASVANAYPDRFRWVASIHPLRADAIDALNQAIAQGACAVKWLPSAMNIDLRDTRLAPFYDRLAAVRLPLIVHVGEEKAVPGARREDLGNPLHLRAPLAKGVRVIAAHCASLGHALDLDQTKPSEVSAFTLFERLMDERSHEGRLMGDISAVFQNNRTPEVWRSIIERSDWHERLLQGSDHPLPGLMVLHRAAPWVRAGLIDERTAGQVDVLRNHNPLLADLVLKRQLRSRGAALSPIVFETRSRLEGVKPVTA